MANKKLFEMYVKELVKNVVRQELKNILPEIIAEYISTDIPTLSESVDLKTIKVSGMDKKSPSDRAAIRAILEKNIIRDGDTLMAEGPPSVPTVFEGRFVDVSKTSKEVQDALTKDYSKHMVAMGIIKK